MRRLSLSSLAIIAALSLSTPVLAEQQPDTTGAGGITAHLVAQAQSTAPTVALPDAPPPPTRPRPGRCSSARW